MILAQTISSLPNFAFISLYKLSSVDLYLDNQLFLLLLGSLACTSLLALLGGGSLLLLLSSGLSKLDLDLLDFLVDEGGQDSISKARTSQSAAVRSVYGSLVSGDSVKVGSSDSLETSDSLSVVPLGSRSSDLLGNVVSNELST